MQGGEERKRKICRCKKGIVIWWGNAGLQEPQLLFQSKDPLPQRRFPANIIFFHSSDCNKTGTKEAGSGEKRINNDNEYFDGVADGYKRPNKSSYTHKIKGQIRQYGKESIEDWNCSDDCPIDKLDKQSGERKGWQSQRHNSFNPYGGNALNESNTKREGLHEGYNDTGGASRFFKTLKGEK